MLPPAICKRACSPTPLPTQCAIKLSDLCNLSPFHKFKATCISVCILYLFIHNSEICPFDFSARPNKKVFKKQALCEELQCSL